MEEQFSYMPFYNYFVTNLKSNFFAQAAAIILHV